jgi:hypothetical protein
MKPALTFSERKALADAAARRLAQEAERKACAEALRKWRAPFALTKWIAERVR